LPPEVQQIGVVLDAIKAIVVCHLILVEEDLMRAIKWPRQNEATLSVVQRGKFQRWQEERRYALRYRRDSQGTGTLTKRAA
jgi:hypothetical protein